MRSGGRHEAPVSVVIPAAGSSLRFGGAQAKQFLAHGGRSLLRWSIEPLLLLGSRLECIVVALPETSMDERKDELRDLGDRLSVVPGGPFRQHSVMNGLSRLRELGAGGVWLVHDAARPLLAIGDLRRLVDTIEETGQGAILAIPVKDTIKKADEKGRISATVDRRGLWQAQTPQGATAELLWDANVLASGLHDSATDDAGILEAAGVEVRIVEGSPLNFKITTKEDWELFVRLRPAEEQGS